MSHRAFQATAAVTIGLLPYAGIAHAQTMTCSPKDVRPSLVRIERKAPFAPGSGFVIVRRDQYAIVLSAKHVIGGLPGEEFFVYFEAAPTQRVSVIWNDDSIFGVSPDSEAAVFRVDAPIPKGVTAEDPFTGEIPAGAMFRSMGFPAARGGPLCSYEGALASTSGGQYIVNGFVEEGVSGGPSFFLDPEDHVPKLVGMVVRGDGVVKQGTTHAIDIRQAVTVVATSRDRRNGNKPHVWPNIPLPQEFAIDSWRSFQRVDAGMFLMGSNRFDDEKWPGAGPMGHLRVLPVFYMGKYEVTVAQYRECVAARVCGHNNLNTNPSEADFPVVGVTWKEASTYAQWFQRRLISAPETPRELRRLLAAGWQIDLPSEEEWERAARKNGTDGYPWGNSPNARYANYNTGRLRRVNSSKCKGCEWGLFDMAGNAREWTRSLKLPYPYVAAEAEDPTAPGNRAIRGGSYKREENAPLAAQIVRSANRQEEASSNFDQYTGFRLAIICRRDAWRNCNWQEPD